MTNQDTSHKSARNEPSRRQALIRQHMASENERRFNDTIATFAHPRYELVGTDQVYDGEDEVRAYYTQSRTVFPDQRNEIRAIHDAGDTIIVEFILRGTHLGSLADEEPSGRSFTCPMVAIFEFEGDGIACERVYFDSETIYRQLRGDG